MKIVVFRIKEPWNDQFCTTFLQYFVMYTIVYIEMIENKK